MAKNKKTDAELAKAITSRSEQSMKEIEKQINAFYGKYATDEGITMAEAKKRVSKLDIDEYAKKAKRYVEGAHSGNELIAAQSFTDQANSEMAIYNLTMKVNRLELLKLEMSLELAAMSSDTERFLHDKLTGAAREEYLRQSGILGMTINSNAKNISAIVGASFHNATWSERLWANQQALRYELDTLLTRGIIQGKNPRVLARELRKSFNSSIADSERLMITEMARIQEAVFTDSMRQADIEEYEYIAEAGACFRCAPLNRKVFKVSEGMPGSNKAPMHPRCRCSSAAHVDREAWESKLNKSKGRESGALNNVNDPTMAKRYAHAEKYYDSVRKRNREIEIATIAKNSNMSKAAIAKVYDHVFINEHELYRGKARFDPDYDMSQSWQRLREGKNIQDIDLVMLRHERLESQLMNRYNYGYREAHELTNKKHNYETLLERDD